MNEQDRLLEYARLKYELSPEVVSAYKKAPRHLFLQIPYSMEEIYEDHPLEIFRDSEFVSTISQPSFVMMMIDMLKLKPGHKVLELGAGSGWNAALMSHIVGESGKVVSLEIIPSLARETRENLKHLGYKNVEIIHADGSNGWAKEAPYDRAIFTAGATDLPCAYHEQIKLGGKLLFVLKTSGADVLLLLDKKEDHFEEVSRELCTFVPMTGEKGVGLTHDSTFLKGLEGRLCIYPNIVANDNKSIFSVT